MSNRPSVIYTPAGRAREYGDLAANLYEGGCPHRCAYCYVPSALHVTREGWQMQETRPRPNILERLAADLKSVQKTRPGECIFLCFTCDPYPAGIDTTMTRRAIELIHELGLGVKILTKGGMRATRDFDLLGPMDWFGVTLTLRRLGDALQWEPNAARPFDRLSALIEAHTRGIRTWASLEPVIYPEQTLEMIRMSYRFVDVYKVGKLNHHPHAKTIDWRKFGLEAIELLEKLGKQYYVKADLRRYLPEGVLQGVNL